MHAVPFDKRSEPPQLGAVVRACPAQLCLSRPCRRSLAHREPPPGASQVNIAPQTRRERQAATYKEDLEKMRLMQRREKYFHYQEGGVEQSKSSLGYINEADRFVTDAPALNKQERDASVNRKAQIDYNKRAIRAQKEEERWGLIEVAHQIEQQRVAEMRENASYARSNKTSMPYNPINLKYDDGSDGARLRFSDESLRYRGALRAEHLQRRSTSTGYDPITGTAIERVHVPEAPFKPGS